MNIKAFLLLPIALVPFVGSAAIVEKEASEKNKLQSEYQIKSGYAAEHDAEYLGNNFYKTNDGEYYKASYDNNLHHKLMFYTSGVRSKSKKFHGTAKKVVVTNNSETDSYLKGKVYNGASYEKSQIYFGENTPTDDYDIASYTGDGNTSDNTSGREWIFNPTREEQTLGIELSIIEIQVAVSTKKIKSTMIGAWADKEAKRHHPGKVKESNVAYDVLYQTTEEYYLSTLS